MFSLYCRALFPENTKQDRSEKLNGGEWKELFIWSLFILLCSKNFPRLVTSLNEFLNEAITPYRAGLEPLRQRFLTCCGSIEFSRPEPLSVELQVSNTPLPPSLINPLPFWNPWLIRAEEGWIYLWTRMIKDHILFILLLQDNHWHNHEIPDHKLEWPLDRNIGEASVQRVLRGHSKCVHTKLFYREDIVQYLVRT